MTHRKSTIVLIILAILVILIGVAYYFLVIQKKADRVSQSTYQQSNADVIRRLTASLNTQSTSTNIADIRADLEATDFSILTEGLSE